MANTRNDGTIYVKNVVGVDVPANGITKGIFAKAIPPWMIVKRYWVHLWMTGKDEMDPFSKQHIAVSGRMANMSLDINDLANASSHDSLEKMINTYMPRGMGQEQFDGDTDQTVDGTELYGRGLGKMSRYAKEREWLHYETLLGLGGKAIMTNSNKIRYTAEWVTKGNVSGHGCNSDVFRLIAIDVNTDTFANDINQDVQSHVFGNTTADADALMQEAYYFFGEQGVQNIYSGDISTPSNWHANVSTPSGQMASVDELDSGSYTGWETVGNLGKWASTGFGTSDSDANEGSGFDSDCQINVQGTITLECKMIKPVNRRVWSPD